MAKSAVPKGNIRYGVVFSRGAIATGSVTPLLAYTQQRASISVATTVPAPAAGSDGQVITLYFVATGASRVITPSGFGMAGGVAPSMQLPVGKLGWLIMQYFADTINRWVLMDMRMEQ